MDITTGTSNTQQPESINLHIEQLVLHGFSPGDRYAIADALERELTRLFAEQGALAHSFAQDVSTRRLDAGAFNVAPDSDPAVIGIQSARSLFQNIRR